MANNLGLREKTKRDALLIIERSRGLNIIGGKNPVAFAAAALYMASLINGEPVTQSLMTSSSGISSVTIRNTAALIKKELQLEV
jgi:transcription initiation factor TFIIB